MKKRLLVFLNTPGGVFLSVVFLTYAPFSWILLINENRDGWLKMWPTLPGVIVGELFIRRFYRGVSKFVWLVPVLSIFLPAATFFLMLEIRTHRSVIGLVALAFFSFLSVFAYLLYLA
jgi:hypothetical protein